MSYHTLPVNGAAALLPSTPTQKKSRTYCGRSGRRGENDVDISICPEREISGLYASPMFWKNISAYFVKNKFIPVSCVAEMPVATGFSTPFL